ncbi:YdeI/OmpD-associated family protein [Algoriphagus confluentis]
MLSFSDTQVIGQLEPRKGGYFFLKLSAEIVNRWENKKSTRLICILEDNLSFRCGLNHLGDGNFFIILATRHLEELGKSLGDRIRFEVYPDPDPLGVEIPEVLEILLTQDEAIKKAFEELTDGKKRSLIYSIAKIKNLDLQIEKVMAFLTLQKSIKNRR